ncbi:MAG: flavin reductase family protein [Deltaproteobacteria bacterium]|nr:flavin reductase family protein [Deltaproteobacteria bacterium]
MHYDPLKNDHGLPQNPFKSCVLPRPIAWISTLGKDGVHNLAPYSQFQNLTFDPPYVMFAANQTTRGTRKDTVNNIEQTGEFVYNMATYDLREAVNRSASEVAPEIDEFELAGLTKAPSVVVKPARVAESPIQFECVYYQTLRLPGSGIMGTVDVIIGRVVRVHIKDEVIGPDGRINVTAIRPLARLGYYDYTTVDSVFPMTIPGDNKDLLAGLEGAAEKTGKTPGR